MTRGKIDRYIIEAGVVLLFFSGLFTRCANVTATMEGGPRDTLPPRVVRMIPAYNATGVRPRRVVIEFDEMIRLEDMGNQFFTSPLMEVKPTVTFKRKSAVVAIDSPLADSTTYVLNLGSGVVDNNENNPAHALKYTFSTGGHIDSMYMSGFVADALSADTMKGAYLFFYDAAANPVENGDSLLFDTRRAAALTRTLSDGGFVFPNLKAIDYRVYALVDANNNQMYDPGTDAVGFQDSVQNPAHLPSFRMWYDSTRMHMVAQPQIFFRTFVETVQRPQNLAETERPAAGQLYFRFAAPAPRIDRMTILGIPSDKILTEYLRPGRDSIYYWLDVPADELPDTLLGSIVYHKPDSTGQMAPHEEALRLIRRDPAAAAAAAGPAQRPLSPRQQRRAVRAAERTRADSIAAALAEEGGDSLLVAVDSLAPQADSAAMPIDTVPASKMKYTFTGDTPVIPGTPPQMDFELPLRRIDTAAVQLYRVVDSVETAVPVDFRRDSLLLRRYTLAAEWADGATYRLAIPRGALETIDGERNDSISHPVAVAGQAELASVTLTLSDLPADYEYIVQVTDEQGDRVLREVPHLGMGTHEIGYLEKRKIRLRLVEDRNRNGRWDAGQLVSHRQPEPIAWYQARDSLSIDLQTAVELDPIDVRALFTPRQYEDRMPVVPPPAPPVEAVLPEEHDHQGHDHDHEGHDH